MKALILCGGTGTRLRPFTYTWPKQLLPIANKPIVVHIIEKVVRAGITDIGIIVGDSYNEIKAEIGDGSRWKAAVKYIHQSFPLGLAHAVLTARPYLQESDFLMILGDNLFEMELGPVIGFYYSNSSNACILLHKVSNPSEYGIAETDGAFVKKVVEKPKQYMGDLAVIGVYVFDKNIFPAIEKIKPSFRGELEITDAIQMLIDSGNKVSYQITNGWWKDTGSPQNMLEANRLTLSCIAEKPESKDSNIESPVSCIQNTKGFIITDSTIRHPVVIGDGAEIINSVIGPYVSIGKKTVIKKCSIENSIVMEDTKLENIKDTISDSLIGRNVNIQGAFNFTGQTRFFLGDGSNIEFKE